MIPLPERPGWWPTPNQELLLKAALLEGDAALDAWRAWKAANDIQTVDGGSGRLLPLLYVNLLKHGVQDSVMPQLKGIYRHSWAGNQMLFHRLAATLGFLRDQSIDTLVLKGAALVPLHYRDYGLRPMDDFDILIRPHQRERVLAQLEQLGWRPKYPVPASRLPIIHGMPFYGPNREHLDLHWHIFWEARDEGADDAFWTAAIPLDIHGVPTLALCPADQLLHTCIHGARWNAIPPLRWVADALIILRQTGPTMDWNRLVEQATRHKFTLMLLAALDYLCTRFDAPVPPDVIDRLTAVPVTGLERAEFQARWNQRKPWNLFEFHRLNYARLTDGWSRLRKAAGLLTYFQDWWGIPHRWQVPFYVLVRAAREFMRRTPAGT